MKEEADAFAAFKTHAEEYIEQRITLIKLQAVEKSSRLCAQLFTGFMMVVLVFCVLIFLSIMAGNWFAVLLNSQFKGFAVIAGIYFLLLIFILTIGRKLVGGFLANKIIEIFFDKTAPAQDTDHGEKKTT